ncbi:MAG: hypothetical protein A2X12_00655 [Bacteroidetes bacterium GWE2_29_8]|nr:MAG: hypothetical protein A2X12_00655 [Bacteroidetes bacterium GWE2_29_8]OFY20644.1 MAG: hypothetical protein A2X02_06175 [Bacteroidetes bacterium GWF2_29_10]
MQKRKTLAILFFYDENWTGGMYYFYNFIRALNLIEDSKRPEIVIISNSLSEYKKIKENISYPYLSFENPYKTFPNLIKRILNKVCIKFLKKEVFNLVLNIKSDILYSILNTEILNINHHNKYCWIPDLQEHFLKDFFSEKEISNRIGLQKKAITLNVPMVFSSQSALNDFNNIYNKTSNIKIVLNFAVFHPDITSLNKKDILNKFGLNKEYFIIPNQFWKHKNHQIILQVAKKLKEQNKEFLFVFTGKEIDFRNPDYFNTLKKYLKDNKLEHYVKFLGFIDRNEQLLLIQNAKAVIQPSLFEGWSTVVEDAKALNQFVIISNIDVHKEQIDRNVLFFDPYNANDLLEKLTLFSQNNTIQKCNYSKNQKDFADKIIELIV